MSLLERRLDNVVTRLGFGSSRPQSRQMITHGHISVNGRKLDIPNGYVWSAPATRSRSRAASISRKMATENLATGSSPPVPDWLDRMSTDPPEGRVSRLPSAQDVGLPVTPQLIIELLSR